MGGREEKPGGAGEKAEGMREETKKRTEVDTKAKKERYRLRGERKETWVGQRQYEEEKGGQRLLEEEKRGLEERERRQKE